MMLAGRARLLPPPCLCGFGLNVGPEIEERARFYSPACP